MPFIPNCSHHLSPRLRPWGDYFNGLLELPPAQFANQLVGDVWSQMPDVFDGKFGQRPHKVSVAASALAFGIVKRQENGTHPVLFISLGSVIKEVGRNGSFYPLNSLDRKLLADAVEIYVDASPTPVSEAERQAIYQLVRE